MRETEDEGRSLFETPTWAVATVITVMVSVGFLVQGSLEMFGKRVMGTRRRALFAALQKIKEELMLFGVLSLLMGHWAILVSRICVKFLALRGKFDPCALDNSVAATHEVSTLSSNHTLLRRSLRTEHQNHCPEGQEPFASYESLEQLHRLLFVLGVVHISYNFGTVVLAMLKLYSWRSWESQARSLVIQGLQGSSGVDFKNLNRVSTFIFHRTSHPWSRDKVLVWMLCFCRQFWSSINRSDYMALRLGFLTRHEIHFSYDFHSYMLRSMEDEFRDIVGISVPLWIYAILCIFLNFHGTNLYFWLSFTPATLILLVGTKLHHIVIKLALEVRDANPSAGKQFNLRDELFWFGKPSFLLWLIQLISFQNAFEMATFLWSLWETRGPSCFMENRAFIIIRLASGVIFQFWCSYITFPLYLIVRQMGSKFKKSVVTQGVRESLQVWRRRAKKSGHGGRSPHGNGTAVGGFDCVMDENGGGGSRSTSSQFQRSVLNSCSSYRTPDDVGGSEIYEVGSSDEDSYGGFSSPVYDSYSEDDDDDGDDDDDDDDEGG